MADSSNRHHRKSKHEAQDGERRIFFGTPPYDSLFMATYDKKSRSWQRDRNL